MAEVISKFFLISGVNEVPPSTLGELIPWLVRVTVAVVLVSGVFRVLGRFTDVFSYRRW